MTTSHTTPDGPPNGAARPGPGSGSVTIDCDTCTVRGTGCGDCVVSVLLGMPGPVAVADGQLAAIGVLARCGLVPPLRHHRAG